MSQRPLGGWGEFWLVVIGAFGIFAITSVFLALHPAANLGHSTYSFWQLILYELVGAAVLGVLLHYRGWTLRSLGLTFHWTDVPIGLGLAAIVWLIYFTCWTGLTHYAPQLGLTVGQRPILQSGLSLSSAVAVIIVNPLYEEVFVTGYIVTALRGVRDTNFAVTVSTAVRLVYHLYQGVVGVALIIPLGLIFATWFAAKRRLWPLIVAHAVFDAIPIVWYAMR